MSLSVYFGRVVRFTDPLRYRYAARVCSPNFRARRMVDFGERVATIIVIVDAAAAAADVVRAVYMQIF